MTKALIFLFTFLGSTNALAGDIFIEHPSSHFLGNSLFSDEMENLRNDWNRELMLNRVRDKISREGKDRNGNPIFIYRVCADVYLHQGDVIRQAGVIMGEVVAQRFGRGQKITVQNVNSISYSAPTRPRTSCDQIVGRDSN